jgi:hypothetical protein
MAKAACFMWVTSHASGGDDLCSCEDLDNKTIPGGGGGGPKNDRDLNVAPELEVL